MMSNSSLFSRFLRGRWLGIAQALLANKKRLFYLLRLLTRVIRRRSLAPVVKELSVLGSYVVDIVQGRYHDYKRSHLILIVALLVYVVSPFDIVPDWIPGAGFVDDIALVGYVFNLLESELTRYRRSKEEQ